MKHGLEDSYLVFVVVALQKKCDPKHCKEFEL